MAAGDVTIDETTIGAGTFHEISGTVEISTTAATAAIVPNGYIVDFQLGGNQTDVDISMPRVALNASDFSATAANGSVHIDASGGAPDVLSFRALYIA